MNRYLFGVIITLVVTLTISLEYYINHGDKEIAEDSSSPVSIALTKNFTRNVSSMNSSGEGGDLGVFEAEKVESNEKLLENSKIAPEKELSKSEKDITQRDKVKHRILNNINRLNQNELAKIEALISNIGAQLPFEIFESEEVDHSWALNRQSELEYGFFAESPLRDIGNLESIVCKTSLCKVQVKVPREAELKPSLYLDWENPSSIAFKVEELDQQNKIIKILIGNVYPD